ncbi:MAG: lipoprotein-releasing ABC transporter ATP-binding protein LolD [Pseudomonadota bacterium]
MSDPVIEATAVHKIYHQGKLEVGVLKGVDLTVMAGESHAILGASGAGKSTLMHLLGGLDQATQGEVTVAGKHLSKMKESELGRLRNQKLGFIYQFHHLLPEFSALENIAMPLLIRGDSHQSSAETAEDWLDRIGLIQRRDHKPGELSGGERQRVALARALITRPACLLADEPTGNLDETTAAQMLELMLNLNRELETSLVVVTHDLSVAGRMQHRWRMQDGRLNAED